MRLARQRARFNHRIVNRLVAPLSGRFALWSLIEHTGRRSGTRYRTPVTMFPTPDGVAVLLAYGEDSDWVRNVQAAGSARVTMSGETFDVDDPRIVPTAQAARQFGTPWRQIVGRMRTPTTLLLRRV